MRRVAVITGAAGGIGRALVSSFEADGYEVISQDKLPMERRMHIVADLAECAAPHNAECQRLIAAIKEAGRGAISAVVHNAAHQVVKPAEQLTECDWVQTMAVNVMVPFWLSMALDQELTRNGGSVVAISSIHERLTKPGFVAYATSKAALSGMIRAMAVEAGGRVRYNAISPAAIATPMLLAGFAEDPDALRRLQSFHPSGRIGLPDEVAATAVFLCSGRAAFINGSCLDVNGGIGVRLHDPH